MATRRAATSKDARARRAGAALWIILRDARLRPRPQDEAARDALIGQLEGLKLVPQEDVVVSFHSAGEAKAAKTSASFRQTKPSVSQRGSQVIEIIEGV